MKPINGIGKHDRAAELRCAFVTEKDGTRLFGWNLLIRLNLISHEKSLVVIY